jgi:hypothetical protein
VGFARNGVIVDNDYLELFQHVLTALKEIASAVDQLEARLLIIENQSYKISELEKIMLDLGFKK